MATYEMGAARGLEGQRDADSKKISFRFCRECSNMLYPKEDRITNTLMFACRTCNYSETAGDAAQASCIYRNSLKETIAETPGNVQDVAQDPTVGDASSSFCDDSAYDMAIDMEEVEGMDVVPDMCTLCGQEILCPICENPTDRGFMLEADDPEVEVREKGQEVVELEMRERSLSGAGVQHS